MHRTVAFAKTIKERAGSLFGNPSQQEHAKAAPEQPKRRSRHDRLPPEMQGRLDELLTGFHRRMEAQQSVEARLADFGNRMDTRLQQKQELARQHIDAGIRSSGDLCSH